MAQPYHHSHRLAAATAACLLVLGGAACAERSGAGPSTPENVFDDASGPVYRLGSATAQIGIVDGDPNYTLDQVRTGVLASNGDIIIANRGDHTIRRYGPDGVFRYSAGREGEGPGEYKAITWMIEHPDGVAVEDALLQRVTVLNHNLEFVHSFGMYEAGVGTAQLAGYHDGRWILLAWADSPVAQGPFHSPRIMVLTDGRGEFVRDFEVAGSDAYLFPSHTGRGVASLTPVFGRTTVFAPLGDSFLTIDSTATTMVFLDPAGKPIDVRIPSGAGDPPTREERAWFIDTHASGATPASRARRREYESVPTPSVRPWYGRARPNARFNVIVEQERNRAFVRHYDRSDDDVRWCIFEDRTFAGHLRIGGERELFDVRRGVALVMQLDPETGVPSVSTHPVEQSP